MKLSLSYLLVGSVLACITASLQRPCFRPLHSLRGGGDANFRPSIFTQTRVEKSGSQSKWKPGMPHATISSVDADETNAISANAINNAFATFDARSNFISKVYMILSAQLFVTFGAIVLFGTNPQFQKLAHFMIFNEGGQGLFWLSNILAMGSMYTIILSEECRKGRMKWWLLVAFTLFESLTVGSLTALYDFSVVKKALFLTTLATTTITGYVRYNRNQAYDLSTLGYFLVPATLCLLATRVLQMFGFFRGGFQETVISSIGAGIASAFIAYRTKTIVGGTLKDGTQPKYAMDADDYVFGAMSLYNDIIWLFLEILRIIGDGKNQK